MLLKWIIAACLLMVSCVLCGAAPADKIDYQVNAEILWQKPHEPIKFVRQAALTWQSYQALGASSSSVATRSNIDVSPTGMFPFVNLFKMATGGGQISVNVTGNGYPTGTLSADQNWQVSVPPDYLGKYVFVANGSATGPGAFPGYYLAGRYVTIYGVTNGSVNNAPNCTGTFPCVATGNWSISGGSGSAVSLDFSLPITGVSNSSGNVQLSFAAVDGNAFQAGFNITVANVVCSNGDGCGANGQWTITGVTGTTITLSATWPGGGDTYTSGGQAWPYAHSNLNPATANNNQNIITFRFANGSTFTGVSLVCLAKQADYNADGTCNTTGGKTAWAGGYADPYVQHLATPHPGSLRFLEYTNNLFGSSVDYAHWPNDNYLSFYANNFIPSLYVGSTSGTNNYTADCQTTTGCAYTLTGGAPADGDTILFTNTNANTAQAVSLTLTDASGTVSSAIPILNSSGSQFWIGLGGSTVHSGDTITLTFTSSATGSGYSCPASHAISTYTVPSNGTSLDTIASALSTTINNDAALTAQPFVVAANAPGTPGGTSVSEIAISYASNACTLAVTASITGTGNETITTGSLEYAGYLSANSQWQLTYDKLLGAWVSFLSFSNPPVLSWDLEIDLANDVAAASGQGVACWLQVPYIWSAASIASFASYLGGKTCNTGGIWIAISNEVWNPAWTQTGQTFNEGASLGFGRTTLSALGLKQAQWFPVFQAANIPGLKLVYEFQAGGPQTTIAQGTQLCGTSCGNHAYQNAIGTDYNVTGQPHTYYSVLSQAPYSAGGMLGPVFGYGGWNGFGYVSWSATSSSVSGNVLAVSGTVTNGPIMPGHGITPCDGVVTQPTTSSTGVSFPSFQLTGTVTTTLASAMHNGDNTITVNTPGSGTIQAGMWIYDANNGMVSGVVSSIAGNVITTLHAANSAAPIYPSVGANDTMIFGGLAGTYQLNNTTCSVASTTITGGDVLGLQYAADNNSGVCPSNCKSGVPYGSQTDALIWAYFDAISGMSGQVMVPTNTLQSWIPTWQSVNNWQGYGLPSIDYEGGRQACGPINGQFFSNCSVGNNITLPNSSYYGPGGYVQQLETAFRNSIYLYYAENYRHTQELANSTANSATGLFLDDGTVPWGRLNYGGISETPFQDYNAICIQNGGSCLPYLLKRDLDPASNDNSPAWMPRAA